jgi:hypothetical protein
MKSIRPRKEKINNHRSGRASRVSAHPHLQDHPSCVSGRLGLTLPRRTTYTLNKADSLSRIYRPANKCCEGKAVLSAPLASDVQKAWRGKWKTGGFHFSL